LTISKSELKRVLLHIPVGLLVCLLAYVSWPLALVFTVAFLYYEMNEDMHISDEAWKDVKGLLWGLGIGGVIMFGLKIGGIMI